MENLLCRCRQLPMNGEFNALCNEFFEHFSVMDMYYHVCKATSSRRSSLRAINAPGNSAPTRAEPCLPLELLATLEHGILVQVVVRADSAPPSVNGRAPLRRSIYSWYLLSLRGKNVLCIGVNDGPICELVACIVAHTRNGARGISVRT